MIVPSIIGNEKYHLQMKTGSVSRYLAGFYIPIIKYAQYKKEYIIKKLLPETTLQSCKFHKTIACQIRVFIPEIQKAIPITCSGRTRRYASVLTAWHLG
jgi:transcription antitermination factor NusA-like protein